MSELNWVSYIGIVTGIIGAITGIAGAMMGFISYRRTENLKTLDLRLELRRAESDARTQLTVIRTLLERANKSRMAVASATGKIGSGAMVIWKSEFEADMAEFTKLLTSIPEEENSYSDLHHEELESRLVAVHTLRAKINQILDKYNSALAADDEERKQIRADNQYRH